MALIYDFLASQLACKLASALASSQLSSATHLQLSYQYRSGNKSGRSINIKMLLASSTVAASTPTIKQKYSTPADAWQLATTRMRYTTTQYVRTKVQSTQLVFKIRSYLVPLLNYLLVITTISSGRLGSIDLMQLTWSDLSVHFFGSGPLKCRGLYGKLKVLTDSEQAAYSAIQQGGQF